MFESVPHHNVSKDIFPNTAGVSTRTLNARDPNTSFKRQVVEHEGETFHIISASIAQPVLS